MTEGAVRHALATRWQTVVPGVYATFTGPLTQLHRLRAATLYCNPNAVITGAVACRLHRLSYVPESQRVDVLTQRSTRRRSVSFVHTYRTTRLPRPIFWFDGDVDAMRREEMEPNDPLTYGALRGQIPIAPPARAAFDAARLDYGAVEAAHGRTISAGLRRNLIRDTRALLCEVVQRRKATVDVMVTELQATPSRGRTIASLAMDDIVAGCRSAPECELRDLFKRSTVLPEPRWNQPLPGFRPRSRQEALTPDACLREAQLVVEVDSVEWHRIGTRQELTEKRRARYAELGWLVISISPYRIRHESDEVLREIERAYAAGLARRHTVGNLL